MSGGVDSSVVALLLKQQGHNVTGFTMVLFANDDIGAGAADNACCSFDSVLDAQRVCWKLGIPHHTLNLREAFGRDVIVACEEEWRRGRTPNPCVLCNSRIKWGALIEKTRTLGFDCMATGHYAQVDTGFGRPHLLKGKDGGKDQSYFLWGLSELALGHTLFPLGELTKTESRALAREHGLPVHDKPESQEICFIPDKDAERFWAGRNPPPPGEIVDRTGRVVGSHKGLVHYTLGQRKGIGHHCSKPQYVVALDPEKNRVTIGDDGDLFRSVFRVCQCNWIGVDPKAGEEIVCSVRIRYRALEQPGRVRIHESNCQIEFDQAQRAITPGQSAVFYQGDRVLGGGIIEEVED